MKNGLRKYDDLFTPDERFRLALAAMAREDDAEIQRLHETCPRHTYTMMEYEFSDRFRRSWDTVTTFAVAWLWAHKGYVEAMWILSMFQREAMRAEMGMDAADVIALVEKRRAELKAAYAGLLRFCGAARLDWQVLLQWWPPLLDDIESVRGLVLDNADVETPEAAVDVMYQTLATTWRTPLDTPTGTETGA